MGKIAETFIVEKHTQGLNFYNTRLSSNACLIPSSQHCANPPCITKRPVHWIAGQCSIMLIISTTWVAEHYQHMNNNKEIPHAHTNHNW